MENRDNEDGDIRVNWRRISFGFMLLVILVTLFLRPPAISEAGLERLKIQQQNFLWKSILMEAALVRFQPESAHAEYVQAIETMIGMVPQTQAAKPDESTLMQKYMVLDYVGATPPELPPLSQEGELLNSFRKLYGAGVAVSDDAPVFQLPTGILARIKQARVDKKEREAARRIDNLEIWAKKMQLLMQFGLLSFFLIGATSVLIIVLFFIKKPPVRFGPVLAPLPENPHKTLLETVIVYLFLYIALGQFMHQAVVPKLPVMLIPYFPFIYIPLCLVGAYAYYQSQLPGPHLALAMIRNPQEKIPWSQEILWGILGFAVVYPVAIMVLTTNIAIMGAGENAVHSTHPITLFAKDHPWISIGLAVVLAPITEEIIFRGFLYGYLRKMMRVRLAALISGSLFAVLHPQGFIAFPVLTIMGVGLAILREYRYSLIPSMLTHALVNATSMIGFFLLFH